MRAMVSNVEAMRVFMKASREYPASTTAASASFALHMKQTKDLNLLDGLGEIAVDSAMVHVIMRAAQAHHHQSEKKAPRVMNEQSVVEVLLWVRALALRMYGLEEEQLKTILTLYPGSLKEEPQYRERVEKKFLAGL